MQLPIKCPCCNHPLLNNFKDYPINRPYQLEKTCKTKLDHQFFCASIKGCEDEIGYIKITVDMKIMLNFNWEIERKKLYISTGFMPHHNTYIPYIEPDLSNYKKLIERLMLLIPFT